jgi:hypothetical protein
VRKLAAVVLLVSLTACGGQASVEPSATPWPVAYGETTCTQWLEEMSEPQQRTAAEDLLVAIRSLNGVAAAPGASLIQTFADAIGQGCTHDKAVSTHESMLTRVASGVYLLQQDTFSAQA